MVGRVQISQAGFQVACATHRVLLCNRAKAKSVQKLPVMGSMPVLAMENSAIKAVWISIHNPPVEELVTYLFPAAKITFVLAPKTLAVKGHACRPTFYSRFA